MNDPSLTINAIGEQGLLQRLQRFCPTEKIGDDGAVLEIEAGQFLVVTTDVLVEEVHFSDKTTSPEDTGWRAVTANLSDLAAMGASPLGITVGLSLPGHVLVSWVEKLYQGLNNCLQHYHASILGGDICRSPVITIGITAFGQVLPHRVIRRSAAQPGDAIVVTGFHGSSRAGLELLLHPELGEHLEVAARESFIQAHQKPKPRLDVLEFLWETSESFSIAGMDSSDGLADAAIQICRCSGVGAEIDRPAIPMFPALSQFVSPEQALEWALYGGEDFELVLCLPQEPAQALVQRLGEGAAIIGKITTGDTVKLVDRRAIYPERVLTLTEGFQHF